MYEENLYNDAAKQGDPVANYSLGLIDFRRSSNLYDEGLRHMKNAAKKNYGPALTAVGVLALSQDRNNQKIINAVADIFKQAYDCGDSTGAILYSLMLMNGEGVATDETWIGEMADQVTLTDETKHELWRRCFCKWFIAMVASWLRDEAVNQQVLVLIGKQGIYKTTWLEHLAPAAAWRSGARSSPRGSLPPLPSPHSTGRPYR